MGLFAQTAILVIGILSFSSLPLIFGKVKKYSQSFFLMGTGAMFGLCFFDLVPELLERGGQLSIFIMIVVLIIYFIIHIKDHHHDNHAFSLFYLSLVLHCFTSGILLVISTKFSSKGAQSVFIALCVHKIYEALMFSFILINRQISQFRKFILLGFYAFSLPLGVAVTFLFKESLNEQLAMILSSIAVGTLIGCLIFDFLLPSLRQIKNRRFEMVFIFLGLILTQLVLRGE